MQHMEKAKYPVSTSDFERIRKDGYVYIDKTAYIHSLVTRGVYYFLGRPRRFGKSLLLSTIEAYYKGKRDLFRGLEIDNLQPGEWTAYPVLRLDLSREAFLTQSSIDHLFDGHLTEWEKELGITDIAPSSAQRFKRVITETAKGSRKKVVILIDEYDAPLSAAIGNPQLLEIYREQLHGFYSVLKSLDAVIQFCMLTGVTKFGKVSVFSGLNNIRDISFENAYAGICGITEQELRDCCASGVENLAREEGWDMAEAYSQLKYNYDGYHFSKELLDIYNPFSVMNSFEKGEINDYWSASGVPTILSKSLRNLDYDMGKLNGAQISQQSLTNLSAYNTNPVAIFYQTGYLTIKGYDNDSKIFTLGYPNREVERGILNNVLSVYAPTPDDSGAKIQQMRSSLIDGKPDEFATLLKAYLSDIPSHLRVNLSKYENYYHTIFYCIASLIGLDIHVEYNTSQGFIDMIIKTSGYIYVIELKVNGSATTAMRQIEKKGYAEPFATDPRHIYLIGLGFSKKTATISSSKILG